LILFAALVLLVLARGAAQRSHAAAQVASAAALAETSAPTEVAAPPSPAPLSPVPAVAVPEVPESAAVEAAPAVPEPKPQKHSNPLRNPVKSSAHPNTDSEPSASSRRLVAPSPSKPKRAIY
jgi:hypothetical protein